MHIVETIVISVASATMLGALYGMWELENARKRYERMIEFYQDQAAEYQAARRNMIPLPKGDERPAFAPEHRQLCGGCGTMRTDEEISKCPGRSCQHFAFLCAK